MRQPFICDPVTTGNFVIRQHLRRVVLQSELKSGPVSRVAPLHQAYVCFTPLLEETPGEIGIGVELDGVELEGTAGISGGVSVSSALGIGISPDKSTAPLGITSTKLILTFFLFSWWLRHDIRFQMRLSLDDQFVPLPLRKNPSFVVLHAQHGHDTQSLSCLLPRSWYDNPENVPNLDGNMRCATVSCIFVQPGIYPNFLRMSCEIFMFRGTGRSSTGTNAGSSRLSIGRGTSGSRAVQIIQRRLFRHRLYCP